MRLRLALLTAAGTTGLSWSAGIPGSLLDGSPPITGWIVASLLVTLAATVQFFMLGTDKLGRSIALTWGLSVLAVFPVPTVAYALFTLTTALLALWTYRRHRLAAVAPVVILLRSVVWWLNAELPAQHGFYTTSAVLTVLALVALPLWLWWLSGIRLAVLLVPAQVVLLALTPVPRIDGVPEVPSAVSSAFVLAAFAAEETFRPASDVDELKRQRNQTAEPGHVCAENATKDTTILYLHGGGFVMPLSRNHHNFAQRVSKATGACVYLADYRLAPEHPFPAAVDDSVAAYRMVRAQTRKVVLLGDSCGASFTFSVALRLKEAGGPQPAAIVALSPGVDVAVTGETHQTKAFTDQMLHRDDVEFSARSYAGGRDPRDPVMSPLYSDPAGLPPSYLLAGSEEVLLSDVLRMADRLRLAQVETRLEVWPGQPHDFPLAFEETMEAELAVRHIAGFVDEHTRG